MTWHVALRAPWAVGQLLLEPQSGLEGKELDVTVSWNGAEKQIGEVEQVSAEGPKAESPEGGDRVFKGGPSAESPLKEACDAQPWLICLVWFSNRVSCSLG